MKRRTTGLSAASLALFASALAGPANAADSHIFHLPAEPVDRAVVRFAIQAGVSVGGLPSEGCSGQSHPTYGLMSSARALGKMLPAGCSYEVLDARSFRVFGVAKPAAPPPSPAPSAPPSVTSLDEIVVTAERREEPLIGRAYAITAVSAADLERLGSKTFADAASQMVGVTVTNLGSGRNKIFIRGLSDGSFTGHTQSTVGLYLDDVPITYSAPDPDLRLVDIDRVEVLRGPQGTLYGSGSIGGIVRIVTAKPDPTMFGGEVTVEAGAVQHGAQGTGLDGTLNLPLLNGHAAIRGSAYRDERPGYIDNTRLGLKDVNYGQRSGGRVAAVVDLSDGWGLQAGLAHQSINTRDSQYAQGSGGPLTRDTQVREPHDNDFTEVSGSVSHVGAVANLKVSGALINHSLQTRYDATGAFGGTAPAAFDEDRSVDLAVAEAVLTSASEGRLAWLVGLFVSQTDETDSAKLSDLSSGAPARSVYRQRSHLAEDALYGEAAYDITHRLTVTVGGRLFNSRLNFEAGEFDLAPGLVEPKRRFKDSGIAPKFRASYAWSPDRVAYIQYQEGFRAGGFNIPAAADGVSIGRIGSTFQPDRLRSYEAGGTIALFDRALRLRAAVFHADWDQLQTDQYLPSGLLMTVNIGNGRNTGLEVEALWRPDAHWQVRGNLLLEDPEITRVSNSFPASVDIGLPGVSRVLGSGDVTYRWPASPAWQAEITGQAAYVGHSFLTFDGATASQMGGYAVARLAFVLSSGQTRIQLAMDNVADERGDTFSFGNPFSRSRARQSTPLRPRTITLSVGRSF
jgi:outer membrane receptor protein involved in Fe transport